MTAIEERQAPAEGAEPLTQGKPIAAPDASPAPARPPVGNAHGFATWVLAAVGVLALWSFFFAVVLSGFQEKRAQAEDYACFRESLSRQVAPVGAARKKCDFDASAALTSSSDSPPPPAPISPGTPVALLESPSLGLKDVVVTEGTASGDLKRGPGHRRDTVLPGELGTSVIYGRSTLFGAPFKKLHSARAGDVITVTDGVGKSTYVVDRVRRVGDPAPVDDGAARLTLVTATGGTLANGYTPSGPLYVDATLKGTGLVAPAGRPASVPASEDVLRGDTSNLFQLVLWLQLLVLVAGGVTWLASRWGAWQTYLVGAPALVAALWAVSQSAVELLPNVM